MANHYKPTKEELEANAKASLEKLETLPADSPKLSEETEEKPVEVIPDTETPIKEPVEEKPVETSSEKTPEDIDYKKKYTESSREAQGLVSRNKELNQAITQAASLVEPTQEELKAEYSEWEEMTPTEQRLAKDNLQNKRKFDLIHTATSKVRQQEDWNDKVFAWVLDPKTLVKHSELEGKAEEFVLFAGEKERRGNDLDTLVLAFLQKQANNKVEHKGQMFPTGQGGGAVPLPKLDDGKLTVEQSRQLMKTDYKKWKEYLKAGKIRNE